MGGAACGQVVATPVCTRGRTYSRSRWVCGGSRLPIVFGCSYVFVPEACAVVGVSGAGELSAPPLSGDLLVMARGFIKQVVLFLD